VSIRGHAVRVVTMSVGGCAVLLASPAAGAVAGRSTPVVGSGSMVRSTVVPVGSLKLLHTPGAKAALGGSTGKTKKPPPIRSQLAELISSDGATADLFGYSVAVSGKTAVVGAPNHQVGSNAGQGAAYVFT
jgi:hypothetical protein